MNKPEALLERCRAYAFLLLKYRLRSEKELVDRLKKKKFPEQVIRETIAFLKSKQFIDDAVFAKSWAQWRTSQAIGPRRLRLELRLKGIDRKIIQETIDQLHETYTEKDVIAEVARQRRSRVRGLDPRTAKRRLFAYLLRRGFSPEEIIDTINTLYA